MIEHARLYCRDRVPSSWRSPLGKAFGFIDNNILRWFSGLLFDLKGGKYRTDGCTFAIPKHLTTRAYRSCFLRDSYENEERELIKEFLRPADHVLELGACIGIVSCVTNRLLTDKTRHVVVEGNPFLIPAIHMNCRMNDAQFLVENCAASNRTEETFYLHPQYIVGGTTQRPTSMPVRLPGRSIKDLCQRYGPFTALIIDIEGGEWDAFSGSRDVLGQFRLIVAELHPWAIGEEKVEECREMMRQAGLNFARKVGITEAWVRE